MNNIKIATRLKKLEELLNPKSNGLEIGLDVSKLSDDDIVYLSGLMKRTNADGKFDTSKLTPDDEVQLNNIIKRQQEGIDTEEN